jgi:hypothetical protein
VPILFLIKGQISLKETQFYDYVEDNVVSPCSTLRQKSFVLDQIKRLHDYLAITDYKAHFACF